MLGILSYLGRGHRRAHGRKPTPRHEQLVEAVERACHAIEAAAPPALLSPAVVEQLEGRLHLTAFNAFISGAATGTHGQNFTINLWTTGQQATQWQITWGDNHTDTYSAPQGGFPVPYQVTHQYSTIQHHTITATATPTTGAAVSATYALNSSFGNVTSQGETVYNPNSGHNSAGKAMAIDTDTTSSYYGDAYVLSLDNGDAAVTRFSKSGAVDTTFGPSTNPGTIIITGLGTGTPTSIAVSQDGRYIAVGGNFNTWGVGLIDNQMNNNQGGVAWSKTSIGATTGQVNAVTFDGTDGDQVYAAGWLTPVACGPCVMAVVELNLSNGNVPSMGWNNNNQCALQIGTGSCTCSAATGIIDMDESGGGEGLALAGTTTYSTGSDFTLAEVTDSGLLENGGTGTDNNFGNGHGFVRANFGMTIPSGNGVVHNPSTDHANALVFTGTIRSGALVAVGSTNATGSTDVALGEWDPAHGTLLTAFGPYSVGLSIGAAGTANSVVVNSTSGAIDIGGTYNNDLLISQFDSGGSLDANNFGKGGNFLIDLGDTSSNSTDAGYGIGYETDSNGNIVSIVIGGSTTPSGGNGEIALADVLTNFTINIT